MISKRHCQDGNVLFLILIAVALFAALSYVIVQSTRSGGGSTEKEKSILNASQMVQYPTMLRSALMRMVLSGTAVENIRFDPPATSGPFTTLSSSQLVFSGQGGGATFQDAPGDLSANGSALTWTYNANFDVPGIGIDGNGGNDIVAFLPGVSPNVCNRANEKLNIPTTGCTLAANTIAPNIGGINAAVDGQMTQAASYSLPMGDQTDLAPTGCANAFRGQASGCFWDAGGSRYVFYSVLLER